MSLFANLGTNLDFLMEKRIKRPFERFSDKLLSSVLLVF